MTRQEFIDKAWGEAVQARKEGAALSVPVVVAQAALETAFGQSQLAREHNNLFGIKGDYNGLYALYPTKEQDDEGNWYTVNAKFRKYNSWREAFHDYGSIIERLSWYQDAEDAAHSPKDFLYGIITVRNPDGSVAQPGWATDHHYYDKVWSIIEEYDLLNRQEAPPMEEIYLLQVYDDGRRYDFYPTKCTLGTTEDGKQKLMVRVKETTFAERLKFLFGLE